MAVPLSRVQIRCIQSDTFDTNPKWLLTCSSTLPTLSKSMTNSSCKGGIVPEILDTTLSPPMKKESNQCSRHSAFGDEQSMGDGGFQICSAQLVARTGGGRTALQLKCHAKDTTIILEAIVDQEAWFWMPRACNDINVLH